MDLRSALIAFRDSTVHSAPKIRAPISKALLSGAGEEVEEATFYRVCRRRHATLYLENLDSSRFVSACSSLQAAQIMLLRAPDPLADCIVGLTVTGRVLSMVYDDGPAGDRKQSEEEKLFLLTDVTSVDIVAN